MAKGYRARTHRLDGEHFAELPAAEHPDDGRPGQATFYDDGRIVYPAVRLCIARRGHAPLWRRSATRDGVPVVLPRRASYAHHAFAGRAEQRLAPPQDSWVRQPQSPHQLD